MKIMTILIMSLMTLSIILLSTMILISKKSKNQKNKSTPFECGFNFFNPAKTPFSMRFFLIAIIFIIFDVEIALILPIINSLFKIKLKHWFYSAFFILLIIILGTLIEWKENSFEWKK